MSVGKSWLVIVAAFGVLGSGALAGCGGQGQNSAAAPAQLSAEDKAKMAAAARQAEIDVRTQQINRSNLPPEEKQRLLNEVRSSAGSR